MVDKNSLVSPVTVSLALQGGGAHGAFTWGVLDRLLEEEDVVIEGISGTSAGSINAALLVHGYMKNGVEGAKEALHDFWYKVSHGAIFGPFQRGVWDVLSGRWNLDHSWGYLGFDLASRVFSPYDLNPVMLNPLRMILRSLIDFDAIIEAPIKIFVNATNVRTGQGRVFHNQELRAKVLLASCCLPSIFQAVEIDGEVYWDGGYTGNPTITPLVQECESHDTILVQINPIERSGTPRSARDILNRENEIAFNACLLKELRMIGLLRTVAESAHGEAAQWAHMRIHRIVSDEMKGLGFSSKLNAEWPFLTVLRDYGRQSAELFLQHHRDALGQHSSLDLTQYMHATNKK